MNPCHPNRGVSSKAKNVVKRLALPVLALCLTILAAAPSGAQQTAQFGSALAKAHGLPTPFISRVPLRLLRAEADARVRRSRRHVVDDSFHQKIVAPAAGPLGDHARPHGSTAATVTVNTTVQTQDLTYQSYGSIISPSGTLNASTPNNQDPFFSTNETYIYFSSDRTSASNPAPTGVYHLFAISPSGNPTTLIQLTGLTAQTSATGETFVQERYPSVIGDDTIAYAQEVKTAAGGFHFDLYVATLQGGGNGSLTLTNPVQITGQGKLPVGTTQLGPYVSVTHPSIVGNNIAFAGVAYDPVSGNPLPGVTSHIYIYKGTYPITQLTGGTADEENPSLSPDEQIVAFDTNAGGYTPSGRIGLTNSGALKPNRDIWLSTFSGNGLNQFTQPAGTQGPSNNIQPIWSQPVQNTFFNPTGNFTYLFFSSDRNAGVYDIYYLRAVDRNPVPVNPNLVVDLEGQDNQVNAAGVLIGTNLAERVNTGSPNHATDDLPTSLQQPIENLYPAVSTLNQYISVVYLSNRYLINGLDDNPVNPTNPLANQSLIPGGAQDIEPANLATDPTPNQTPINFSYDLLSSQLVAIDPPTLLNYDPTNNEIIHVEDTSAQPGLATRSVLPGNTARFIVRLSERQTGVSKAFLQIKNPNSKYQDSQRLEHKVFSRMGLDSDFFYGVYSDHPTEDDEATTTFLTEPFPGANARINNDIFDLNAANAPGGPGGTPIFGNAVAGQNGGPIEVGTVLPYTGPLIRTVVVMPLTGSPPPVVTSLVVAPNDIGLFQAGDTVRITLSDAPSSIDLVLNSITKGPNNDYTFGFKNPTGIATDVPTQTIPAFVSTVTVVDRFDPQGQEVDCEAMDAIDYGSSTASDVPPTVSNYSVPKFTAGISDALLLSGLGTLTGTPGVDTDRGPLNAQSGNPVWLQLTPFVPSSSIYPGYPVAAGAAIIPVTETSGIVPGDLVQIGTGTASAETVTVLSVAVAQNLTIGTVKIQDGTPLIVLDGAAPLLRAHAAGATVTLISSPSGGILYQGSFITPSKATAASDYYIDAIAFDNAAYPLSNGDGTTTPSYDVGSGYFGNSINWRIYDNVWGFSTQGFLKQGGVLVVSDYTLPQKFYTTQYGTASPAQAEASVLPITDFGAESYLTDREINDYVGEDNITPTGGSNFGSDFSWGATPSTAQSVGSNSAARGYIYSNADDISTQFLGYVNTLGVYSYMDQDQATPGAGDTITVPPGRSQLLAPPYLVDAPLPQSQKYDIWRILARGPLPANILSEYAPTTVAQPDTNDTGTHPVQVANGCVLWSSPFAGDLFVGNGTIIDPATQTDLENFVDAGGRLFVEGIDVGFALTNNGAITGTATNKTFYTDYLRAMFMADDTGFNAGVYTLGGKGAANTNFISNDAYRNNGQSGGSNIIVQHRGFDLGESTVVDPEPPYKNAVTIAHTPFDDIIPPFLASDASLRSDGSLNAGIGIFISGQGGNIDAVAPIDPTYDTAPFFRPAAADLSGSNGNLKDQLLYYFGAAALPSTAHATTLATINFGTGAAKEGIIPVGSITGIAAGDTLTITSGAKTETVTVSAVGPAKGAGAVGVPDGTPVIVTGVLKNTYPAGALLTRTASTTFTNFVGYSPFGLETLSQELIYKQVGTAFSSNTDTFVSHNQRTNLMHNLICTMRTGTITGTVRSTQNGNQAVGGAFIEVTLVDNITGKPATFTALSAKGTGRYEIDGVLPGLYSYNANAAGFSTTHAIYTNFVHGGDSISQDIKVTPVASGIVTVSVKDTSGNPIPGIVVTLTERNNAFTFTTATATSTDPNAGTVKGTAVFPQVPPSSFGYIISYADPKNQYDVSFLDANGPVQTPPNPVIAVSGQTVSVVTVLSPKPATVYGLVTAVGGAANGQPLTGVTVTFKNPAGTAFTTTTGAVFNGPDSTPSVPKVANYPLNDDPAFTLPASPTGVVYTYTATFPNYVTVTGAVTLTTAESLRLDIALPLAGNIKLVVINSATGQPLTGVVGAASAPGQPKTTVVSGGPLVSVVPNAAWTVTLPASVGGASQTLPVVAGQTTTYTFTVTPAPGSVTGTITDLGTKLPIPGAVVTLTGPSGATIVSAPTGANGVYTIPNVPSGITYTATATATGYTSVSVAGLIVTPATTTTQNFVLASFFGTLTGVVTDSVTNAPIVGATVSITGGGKTYAATTVAGGAYVIKNVLAAGSPYTATVSAPGFVTATTTGLTVPADGSLTQNFKLVSTTGSVSGRVTDSVTGAGLIATVTLTGGGHTYTGTTNSTGNFTITGVLVAGSPYKATATATQYLTGTTTVTVTPSATASLNFVLVSSIIHHYPGGLQMFSAPYDYSGQPLASVLTGEVSKTTGAPVNLVAAWVTMLGAYALTPSFPCETLHVGQGYFARFGPSGGNLSNTGTVTAAATFSVPLHSGWNMIGDPYTTAQSVSSLLVQDSAGNAPVSFATATSGSVNFVNPQLYSYDQATNTYLLVEVGNPFGGSTNPSITPYVGYWIFAYTNCSLIFTK